MAARAIDGAVHGFPGQIHVHSVEKASVRVKWCLYEASRISSLALLDFFFAGAPVST